jgi:ribosome biogenesis GTPase
MELVEGTVIRAHGGHYYVQTDDGLVADCALRGRLKRTRARSDLVATGDRVRWRPTQPGCGVIEEVLPRKSALSRASGLEGTREEVIVANLDQVVVVFAVHKPPFDPFMLDRYLVACEAAGLPAVIVINKVDLLSSEDEREAMELYRRIGYRLLYTSALTGEGVEALRIALRGKVSALTGPSGVGKSCLLNALWPQLNLEVGEISAFHQRGKHTTVVAQLLAPEPGTYVADTPGLRQFHLWNVDPRRLASLFPEMAPYRGQCRFSPCTHRHEPDCAVRRAVEEGEIAETRYESYCRLYEAGS